MNRPKPSISSDAQSFVSDADDFGFLVPTPTQPELAEASDASFKHLEMLLAQAPTKKPAGGKGGGKGGAKAPAAKVEVLDEKRVANQHMVVLKTNDVNALAPGSRITTTSFQMTSRIGSSLTSTPSGSSPPPRSPRTVMAWR